MFKHLFNQRGQVPGGFFWGNLLQGIAGGIEKARDREAQREEMGLKKKMLDMQIKSRDIEDQLNQRKLEGDIRQQAAQENLANLFTQGAPQELQMAAPGAQVGQLPAPFQQPAPQAIPERLPPTQNQIYGALAGAQPKEFATGLMRQYGPGGTGATGAQAGGYDTLDEALTALRSAGQIGRVRQDNRGKWHPETIQPVNVPSNEYFRALGATGDPDAARRAREEAIYRGAVPQGAGQATGAGMAVMPEGTPVPPRPGVQPGPTPGTVQPVAPPNTGTYPTSSSTGTGPAPSPSTQVSPRPGETPAAFKARLDAFQRGRGTREAEAQEALSGLEIASGLVSELDQLSKSIFTTPANAGIFERGMGAATQYAQSWDPASPMGIYTARKQTVGENLARNIGGVRGTATEGDIYRMLVALPRPGDTDQSRAYKIQAFQEIVNLAIRSKQRFLNGEPIDLEQAKNEFRKLADQYVGGSYKLGTAGAGAGQGRLVPVVPGRGQY